ncbi:hypothetical protein POTOM_001558 [Populus tomentosa]|uniref:Transmembrane protein n=1 Tax=Populus tomentosa TaxID=118781 RepID=A0A8X8DI47_POPTO|nr:hypothetical protein POTOM_001558 [Populus tomentosa]
MGFSVLAFKLSQSNAPDGHHSFIVGWEDVVNISVIKSLQWGCDKVVETSGLDWLNYMSLNVVKLLVVVLVLTLVKNIDASFVIDGEVVALLYFWWRGACSYFPKLKRYDVCLCKGIGSRPKNITISLLGSEGVLDLPSRVVMISASNTLSVRARLILLNILDIENLLVIAILLDCLATLSQLQDRVQIFLAVLFWMSLFFWASIWDGKNNGRGRLNKGSRFKR